MFQDILSETSHRPYELPKGNWKYYQEWNRAIFFHWDIPYEILRPLIPSTLNLDNYKGQYWISIVAFTMEKIRPSFLPSISFISNFHEINLRTYVVNEDKAGVFFLSIEAEKLLSAFIANKLSGLRYEKAKISRTENSYSSVNYLRGFFLESEFEIKNILINKTALDKWLTERYCLYLEEDRQIFRYDIHHKEWKIQEVNVKQLKLKYAINTLDVGEREPNLVHYSEGVKVVAWNRKRI